jgi:hypothetical protein
VSIIEERAGRSPARRKLAPGAARAAVPPPDVVSASRRHLTARYAQGLDRYLWDSDQALQPDQAAIHAVVAASRTAQDLTGPDLVAALVLIQVARLELGIMEAGLLAAADRVGVPREVIAAAVPQPLRS